MTGTVDSKDSGGKTSRNVSLTTHMMNNPLFLFSMSWSMKVHFYDTILPIDLA